MEGMKQTAVIGRTRAKHATKAPPEPQQHPQASLVSANALTGIYRVALSSWPRLPWIQSGWQEQPRVSRCNQTAVRKATCSETISQFLLYELMMEAVKPQLTSHQKLSEREMFGFEVPIRVSFEETSGGKSFPFPLFIYVNFCVLIGGRKY